ncbi:MAG: hypothetical protein V4549_03490 [Bacteroidota bacterium]
MQKFAISRVDLPYTEIGMSDWFDYSNVKDPQTIELCLNVSKLQMAVNDGSVLGVIFERTIDGVVCGDNAFATVNIPDDNMEPSQWLQTLVMHKGDLDPIGKEVVFGSKGRFRYFLSQASLNNVPPMVVTPSIASFEAGVVVK